MLLKCKATCTEVHKKSQSPAFKNLRYGDIIEFSVEIKAAGRNKGTYATYIRCFNPQTKAESKLSFNQIVKTLECFEFEEVEEMKSFNIENFRVDFLDETYDEVKDVLSQINCSKKNENKTYTKGHYRRGVE